MRYVIFLFLPDLRQKLLNSPRWYAELVPRQSNKLVSCEWRAGAHVLHETRKKIWDESRRKCIWALSFVVLLGCYYNNVKWVRTFLHLFFPNPCQVETERCGCREIGDIIPSNNLEIGFTIMLMIFNLTLFRYWLIAVKDVSYLWYESDESANWCTDTSLEKFLATLWKLMILL